ncbi:MAG: trimethylamine methyltransferase family protein, partial [Anaerolineaceae bacterium]|nr:trimethylamine methyltransferase family protein [Anaerolineaceae bacterium]
MNDTDLEKIHQTSIKILADLGIQLNHAVMRDRLAGLGCKVRSGRVYIPADLVAHTVEAIPSGFKLFGRDDQEGIDVGFDGPFLCTNTGVLPNIYDFESGVVRRSVQSDVATTARVLDALSELDIVYATLMDATDQPSHLITVSG